ncbi:hypothetical protein EIP91_007321 [Steccherinum ochraceum]|uniref:Response regulatory domain-containing protein n=1 Tax=Steccherinum ochraceum TaxID=92696 RepID=A0A4R0S3Y2_9APHY|nr:hypothetical protein EIP91_007321 [Steccherinum ochraceum]
MPGVHTPYSQPDGPVASSSTHTSPASSPVCPPRHTRLRGGAKFSRPRWSSPPRVLLVDDDAVYRMLSGRLLKVFGCTIDTADDGRRAVDVLRMNQGKYDLVFMDIMMPNLDGISATSLIRQFDEMTPIISVTSNSLPSEILTYYSSGMNDVLPKPFTRDGVLSILQKHLVHMKSIQEMSAHNSPHLPKLALPTRAALTPPPSPRWSPQPFGVDERNGKENSDAGVLFPPNPATVPAYPRATLAPPMAVAGPSSSSTSYLPPPSSSSSPLSSPLSHNNDATHIPAISLAYTSSSLPPQDPPPYLVLPQSPQSPQSQTSSLLDVLPDADAQCTSDFLADPDPDPERCTLPLSPDSAVRILRNWHGVKRALDRDGEDEPEGLEGRERERKRARGKVD